MSNVILLQQPQPVDLFGVYPLDRVEQIMMQLAHGERSEHTGDMVTEHLQTGGKRLRARLALAATRALQGPEDTAIYWASAVEMLHNATLVHDDIQDGDEVRRGYPTTWVLHGEAQAINAGDLMLMLPFLALSRMQSTDSVRWHLSWRLADQAAKTVRGQVEEIDMMNDKNMSKERYLRVVQGKTGGFFALPIEGAALICGFDKKEAQSLGDCFLNLGVLFQMQDDILDLYGDKGRGETGGDIYEGKPSILVLHHLLLHPEDHDFVWEILSKSRLETHRGEVEALIALFRHSGALKASLEEIEQISAKLRSQPILRRYPDLSQLLHGMIDQILDPLANISCP